MFLEQGRDVVWRSYIEEIICRVPCVAVFVGSEPIDRWQKEELDAAMFWAAETCKRIVPVLLTDAPDVRELPACLRRRHSVDFRRRRPDPFDALIGAIVGNRGPGAQAYYQVDWRSS